MAADEAADHVARTRRPRPHRVARHQGAQVVAEFLGRRVALAGVLLQGLGEHAVQVLRPGTRQGDAARMPTQRRRDVAAQGNAQLVRGLVRAPERMRAGQGFVQQQPERVDVGGGRDGFAAQLFGGGIGRRQRAAVVAGQGARGVGFEQLGDAVVEQLGDVAASDHQVGRLDVAVYEQAAMGVGHRVAHLQEQREARGGRRLRAREVGVPGLAVDVLEGEKGNALGIGAGIDEAHDVGVVERGEDVALVLQAAPRLRRQASADDALDRHGLRVVAIAVRPVHDPGTALADPGVDHEPAHSRARRQGVDHIVGQTIGRYMFGQRRCVLVREQFGHVLGQRGVVHGEICEQASTCRGVGRKGLDEHGLHLLPARGVASRAHGASSRASQSRARVQSRLTVATEMPSTCAISSSSSPPKKRSSTTRA